MAAWDDDVNWSDDVEQRNQRLEDSIDHLLYTGEAFYPEFGLEPTPDPVLKAIAAMFGVAA